MSTTSEQLSAFNAFFLGPLVRRQRISIARSLGEPWAKPVSPDMAQMLDDIDRADVRRTWRRVSYEPQFFLDGHGFSYGQVVRHQEEPLRR